MLGFNHAEQINLLPYPFPLAQILAAWLAMLASLVPFISLAMAPGWLLAPGLTFFVVFGYYNLNEVAIAIEAPYGTEIGDLPLLETHEHFIDAMEELYKAEPRPVNQRLLDVAPEQTSALNSVEWLNLNLEHHNINYRFSDKVAIE